MNHCQPKDSNIRKVVLYRETRRDCLGRLTRACVQTLTVPKVPVESPQFVPLKLKKKSILVIVYLDHIQPSTSPLQFFLSSPDTSNFVSHTAHMSLHRASHWGTGDIVGILPRKVIVSLPPTPTQQSSGCHFERSVNAAGHGFF